MKSTDTTSPTSPISDDLLQRYFDGELPAAERADLEACLDGDARLRLEALGELRGLLRTHVADTPSVDLSSVIDSIERAAPTKTAPTAPAPKRRWIPMSAMGGFLAAAAALVFFFRPVTPTRVPGGNHAQIESLEVEGAVATVFEVGQGDEEATVIWTDDSSDSDNAAPTE